MKTDSYVIEKLTDVIDDLTDVIGFYNKNKQKSIEVDFDSSDDPFGLKSTNKVQEKIVEVPVEVIKEVEKIVEVPVEVIKEVIKEIFVSEDLTRFETLDELIEYNKSKKSNNLSKNIKSKPKSFDFPDVLVHSSGTILEKMIDPNEYIYKPPYILKPNQCVYGVKGEWSVVVEYKNNKYITEHPQEHFNNVELTEQNDI